MNLVDTLRQALKSKKEQRIQETWESRINTEVHGWHQILSELFGKAKRTLPKEWFDELELRLDPLFPLQTWVASILEPRNNGVIKILDVGAGPLTILGKTWDKQPIHITAVDTLALEYKRLLDQVGGEQLIPVTKGDAERVHELFAESSFDLVVSHNALDHTYNPVEALKSALRVVKPSCWVALWHVENEGQRERYDGVHQWNFTSKDGKFVIWNQKVHYYDVLRELSQADQIVMERQNHHDTDWLHVRIRKNK